MTRSQVEKLLVMAGIVFSFLISLSPFAVASTIQLPATGQTTSYTAGDDGALKKGVTWPAIRFTDNSISAPSDLTVTDNLSGLIWTKDGNAPGPAACGPGVTKTWQGALDYAACLNSNSYLGKSDWRIPTTNELLSLINWEQTNTATWLNAQGFSNVQANYYWSSSTYAGSTDDAWVVYVSSGYVGYLNKTNGYYVWPVRGGQWGSSVSSSLTTITPTNSDYGADGSVTVTVSSASATPTGNATLSVDGAAAVSQALSAVVGSDPPAASAVFTLTKPAAGSHALSADYAAQGSFGTSSASGTLVIAPKLLTITATGVDKTYNGNPFADVVFSDNRVPGDSVTVQGIADFATKTVGAGIAVTVSGVALSGADSGNYTASAVAPTTAAITPRALTVTATGQNKVYDGDTTATVTLADDRLTGDVLSVAGSAAFATKAAGTGKTVTISDIAISGAEAGNYTTSTATTTTADITPRALTVTATGQNKVYDGNTTATVTLADDRLTGDVLSVAGSAAFATKAAGTGKTVTISDIAISGADAGNYTTSTGATTTADITPRALTVTATGQNKVYDGDTTATVSLADDRLAGDVLSIAGSAAFATKAVGTGKTVTVSDLAKSGTDAGNYALLTTSTTATANIVAKPLIITALAANKMYDRTANASVTLTDNRVAGDTVTVNHVAAVFNDKLVGENKTVTVSDITISGADAGNYTTSTGATTTAAILASGGDLDGNGLDISDAMRMLRIIAGLETTTAEDMLRMDVAPLVNGIPQPDEKIDIGDVTVLLRKVVGLVNW